MKTRLFEILIIALVFVAAINEKFYADTLTKEIHWVNTYDEGLKIANEKDKSMFILITAPTWCHYCKVFEKKILKNEKVKDFLNENYVPVLVLDQINGKRNPDLSHFSFPGFPTAYVYNKSGKMVKDVSVQGADRMLSLLKKYAQVSNTGYAVSENITENYMGNSNKLTKEENEAMNNFMNEWVKR